MGRKLKRGLLRLVVYSLFIVAVFVTLAAVGLLDGFVRSAVVTRIERLSGGRVEMEGFRFHWLALRAELEGLTIHGREPEGTPPLFHAKKVLADARVISVWSRKVALDELILERPEIHVRIDKEGHSNFSGPATASPEPGKPLADRILELQIGKLRFNDGEMLINDVRVPLAAEGGEFRLAVDFHPAATPDKESYTGEWSWKQLQIAARRYLPVVSDVGMKITMTRAGFRMDEFKWTLPHSRLEASAALASYAKPDWTFQYRAGISLTDIRDILRKPHSPAGQIEVSGAGKYQAQELNLAGEFDARDVALPYEWFHAEGIRGRGKYQADTKRLRVTDIQATALGGETTGQVEMIFDGQQFRAETKSRGVSLAAILAAVEHEKFPLTTLHWESRVDADAISTWSEDFKHFRTKGNSVWTPSAEPATVGIPTAARLQFDYSLDERAVDVGQSEISTSATRLQFAGRLGLGDSQMNVHLEARDLLHWNDFINSLRGVGPESDTEPKRIAGNATWDGRITGHLDAPQFSGHASVKEAAYEELYWDDVAGELTYSPEQLRLEKVRARRGKSSAALDLWLDLYDWSFRPENEWSFTATLNQEDSQGMQEFLGWKYPARALLTGEVHGGGTRGHPEFSGRVAATGVEAWGWTAERLSGEFRASREELQVSNAEIQKNGGQVCGSLLYRAVTQEVEFDGNGTGIQLDKLEPLQRGKFSIGGELSFQVHGSGAIAAPVSQGTMKLANLRVGKDTLGTLEGDLRSDGRNLHATLRTEMSGGEIAGKLDVVLGGAYPVAGDLQVKNVDLDFLIQSAFRLENLSGHSHTEGRFRVMGELARPQTLVVEADISHLVFDYQFLKLENEGPLRFSYRAEEVRIEQAHIRGPETDFQISGLARFTGERALNLKVEGTVNLRLLTGLMPQLEARGAAQINATIEGQWLNPRINGKLRVENVAANYGDLPTGLSEVIGEVVFDANRMVFQNVQATAGGGTLLLSGTMNYGEGTIRYDLTGEAKRVRVRYPEGMGWLGSGTLRFSGTTRAAVLGGRVAVQRVLLSEGFDLSNLVTSTQGAVRAPAAASPFMRNLQFDLEVVSSPDARVEWSGARFESEAALRVRGTWEHPILLGHIHLLIGEMMFRGNRYRLTRGDINFSKPFRLDPDLNVEVTTTIRQYDVTLNISGPSSKLNLAYRSDPPMPSGDIITLLALGNTGEESELRTSTTSPSGGSGANALLSEAISSQLGGRIEKLFGVSRFRVDPFLAGTGTEQNASARITIEQQLTRDLVVTYITNVSSTQHQVFQVEYSVNRDVSIVALRDQNGTFGLDFKIKKRFK